ncbi:hypothetical protein [Kineococcus terrestris]|uniref:hypothetical protein n=1 Tax=Kineococcus terrestris TaxID=2044856 RepID=UPI0034DB7215
MNERPGDKPLEQVLQQLLRQGRLDPAAERVAAQGIERLKAFLGGAGARPEAAEPVEDSVDEPVRPRRTGADAGTVDAEVVGVVPAAGVLRHTVPLLRGGYAEVVVPERLTRADADRIAAVLAALAVDDD